MYSLVKGIVFLLIGAACVSGCKQTENVIACAESEKLSCPQSSLLVTSLGANQYTVSGCGKIVKVSCKGPADGCLIEETKDVLNTTQCLN